MNSVTHKLQIPAPDGMASTMVQRGRYIRKHDCRRAIENSLTVITVSKILGTKLHRI